MLESEDQQITSGDQPLDQGDLIHKGEPLPNRLRTSLLISLLLIVLTLGAFSGVRNNHFISLDDNIYVTENRYVQEGLSLKSVVWASTSKYGGHWHPITWLSHMLDYDLFGLNPAGHHLINLLFHIANTLLLFLVLCRMTGAPWQSGFVAALFALHPLHVESVAWVAERKDVLCAFFWMLTTWAYVRYVESRRIIRYGWMVLCFVLALMSKPMAVTLPFVLLLLDYWPLGRFNAGKTSTDGRGDQLLRLILEKIPLLILTVTSSIFTFLEHMRTGTVVSFSSFPLGLRIGNAVVSYVTYIAKMIWPSRLAILYPHPSSLPLWEVTGAALLLMIITVAAILAAKRRPYLIVGWLWYLGTLVPVIGFVQAGIQARADRFTYIPLIGLFIMIVYGVTDAVAVWRHRKLAFAASTVLVLCVLLVTTFSQVKVWQNDLTLFEHTLRVTQKNYVIHNNLGVVLAKQGRDEEAAAHYKRALEINWRYADANYNMGAYLARKGKYREAMTRLVEALRANPRKPEIYNQIGVILVDQGKSQEAIPHFKEALRFNPNFEEAHRNLGTALLQSGRDQEAVDCLNQALRMDPRDAKAHSNLGVALGRQGKIQEAMAHFDEALRINPSYADVHYNVGEMLSLQGKIPEAIADYDKFLQACPKDVEAHYKIGVLLARQGKKEEAIGRLVEAVGINPDHAPSHYTLGIVYWGMGKKDLALKEWETLRTLNPELANTLRQRINP